MPFDIKQCKTAHFQLFLDGKSKMQGKSRSFFEMWATLQNHEGEGHILIREGTFHEVGKTLHIITK